MTQDSAVPDQALADSLLAAAEGLFQLHDLSSMLDRILLEARRFTRAEAGSIFLENQGRLVFSYVHNEVLFTSQAENRFLYQDYQLPMDQSSLCGYAAVTGQPLRVDDAYRLPAGSPYAFNQSFDQASGYRTGAVLAAPMITSRGRVVGVVQIINPRDAQGASRVFDQRDQTYVAFFANHAALALERALITRELILRTAKITELRDPKETGAHVNRVGAYSAEIYECWAQKQGQAPAEIKYQKDIIRMAAMQHDVGKVAISDLILKKPGRLTPEEFRVMQLHTVYGARLFDNTTSEMDAAAQAIALNHHERWDGGGYPGHIPDLMAEGARVGPGKRGQEIPLFARVVALADVFDALISARVYKPAWPEEKVLDAIRVESGGHFDPQMVEAFFEIYQVIDSIRRRYQD